MNLRKRRAAAYLIDTVIISGIIAPLNTFLTSVAKSNFLQALFFGPKFDAFSIPVTLPGIMPLIVIALFSSKDIVFKNAGIGKKIMGLKIMTGDDKKPRLRTVFFRGLIVVLGGIIIYGRCRYNGVDIETWELNHLGTKIVASK